MNFNVVIGNPPYNDDAYLDFVTLGHQLANNCSVWITPAKWQSKGQNKVDDETGVIKKVDPNELFRKNIVPYMSDIVFYENTKEVFRNITMQGGITYFLINKHINQNKRINSKVYKNWDVHTGLNLSDVEASIIQKISKSDKLLSSHLFKPCKGYFLSADADDLNFVSYIDNNSTILYKDATQVIKIRKDKIRNSELVDQYKIMASGWASSGCSFKYKIYEPYEVCGRKYVNIFVGSIHECKSAASFYSCRLIWWLVHRFYGASKLNTYSFSLVPDPGSFDRIFEDRPLPGYTPDENGEYIDSQGNKHCSLYIKYKLTDEEVNTIESVIKAR